MRRQAGLVAPGAVHGACSPAAVSAGAGFVVRELRATPPIIELRCFRDADFALLNLAHMLLNLAGFAVMLLVPFYLDRVGGLTLPAVGGVLAASPVGIMLAAPLAGRWAGQVPPWRLALFGAAAMAAGQLLIGIVGAQPMLALLVGAMTIQGFGLGLFQVAYFEVATTLIPRQDRGVAGSLVMMTRTVGIVLGATVLMLVFQALRAAAAGAGATDPAAFIAAFQGTFRIAAAIPLAIVACALLRGWTRLGGRKQNGISP